MPTVQQVLDWRPSGLSAVGDGLTGRRRTLTDLQDEVDAGRPPFTWHSGAADSARSVHEALRLRLLDIVAEVGRVLASVDFAQGELTSACDALQDAVDAARAKGFDVDTSTGIVNDPRTYPDAPSAHGASVEVSACAEAIGSALDAAVRADGDLADALRSAARGQVDGGTGSLASASHQLPGAVVDMSPEEIAARYGDGVAIETIEAYLDAEFELATWELEGSARGTYEVFADGHVQMKLRLEAGLGREIDVGGAEVDVSGGGTTELELTFDSPEEAQAFMDGFADAATDVGFSDIGNVPGTVAQNVAEYVAEQDVTGFRTGIYGEASAEFDTAWAEGEATGRVEGYYDWVQDQYGLKMDVSADAAFGGADSGYSGSGGLAGEMKFDDGGDAREATFQGQVSGSVAAEKLGIDLPNTSTGAGVDVQVTMDDENEHFDAFVDAMQSGDVDGAAALAMDEGNIIVRQTSIVDYGSGEFDVDAGPLGGAEVEYGATGTVAEQVWIRPPGMDRAIRVDAQSLGTTAVAGTP